MLITASEQGENIGVGRGWGEGSGEGGTPKFFWRGCVAPVFDQIPLAKENWVENICVTKNFLTMSPLWRDFKEFKFKYSLVKRHKKKKKIFQPQMPIFRGFRKKDIPLAKDFGRKIYPWLRIFAQNTPLAKEFEKVALESGIPPVRSST